MPSKTVPVTSRAILARVNRQLAKDGQSLKKCPPGSKAFAELGPYYLINGRKGLIRTAIDLPEFATELGCLRPYERITD